MNKLLTTIINLLPAQTVYAHCDIPCGIYDPTPAQIAAHTVLRMVEKLLELPKVNSSVEDRNTVIRCVHVKEEHGGKVEEELGTLENDYFKPEHHEKFPELAGLLKEAVNLSVEARQSVSLEKAEQLLEKVLQVSEIFYKTKNVTPKRVPSIYPTKREIVTYSA